MAPVMRRRVVITGMGAVTPLGHSVAELYGNQLEGKSGVDRIRNFDASRFPTTFAAEVKGFDLGRFLPHAERWADCGVNTRFGLAAAKQALEDANLLAGGTRERFGVYLGNGEGQSDFQSLMTSVARSSADGDRAVDSKTFLEFALRSFHGGREGELEMHPSAGRIAEQFELDGPNYTCLTACAASSQAIGEATELIRHGDADVMLAGGSHSMIHP